MRRRTQSVLSGGNARRARPRVLATLALFAVGVLCLVGATPAAAAVADSYEPDGSFSAAKPLTVDAAAQQHTIFPAGDQDWVLFTVTAGQTYTIETASGSPAESIDTVLYLYDADGTTEIGWDDDGGAGAYSLIEYVADSNTTVYAKVVGYYSDAIGAYDLGVSTVTAPVGDIYEPDDSSAAATPITVDAAAQQHTIHHYDDEDWVSFTVTAGRAYTIQTAEGTPADSMDTVLYLYDSNGTTLIDYNYDDPGSWYSRIDYAADADKTVYVRAKCDWADGPGAYALSVSVQTIPVGDAYEPDDSSAAATPITVDAPAQQHTIHLDDDEDWVSFTVETGYKYALTTAPGASPDDPNTELYLYDSDGTTLITSNGDDETEDRGYYSRIDYTADADKTVYAKVTGWYTGTYALGVTRTPIMKIGVVPTSIDFGEVAVGASLRRTVVVENQGVAPLDVGSVQLTGAGFSIVRDDAGGTAIPVGESREIEVAYAPSVAYTGAPAAVQHDWTNVIAVYNYSGGVLVSVSLFTGLQNLGGAGDLGWRVRIGATDWTGAGAVVAGGRYKMRVVVSSGSGSLVQVLEPISDTFNNSKTGSSVFSVAYLRVPDAYLSIASNDDDDPTVYVSMYGVAVPAGPDATPPTTTDDSDGLWHNTAVTVDLSATDNVGGSGMSGGLAKTEYSKDGGATWVEGTSATYAVWKRGGGSGLHTLLYRSTDAAGNLEAEQSCAVMIDARAPVTANDAPLVPQAGTVTVHLTAVDSMFGVTACSGVASVTYSLDGGAPQTVPGASASVPVSGAGLHWIAYYATDNAGNAEYVKWCSVTILASGPAKRATR